MRQSIVSDLFQSQYYCKYTGTIIVRVLLTDGAASMTGSHFEIAQRVKVVSPFVAQYYCFGLNIM